MTRLLLILPLLLLTAVGYSQTDSVQARVTWSDRIGDTSYYQIKIKGEKLINMKCCCKTKRSKGDIVMIAKKDLLFYEDKIKFKSL